MAGTKSGGAKAAATNKAKHGPDFYREIGRRGGRARSKYKGFGANLKCAGTCDFDYMFGLNHRTAQCAGYKGGLVSRRKSKKDD